MQTIREFVTKHGIRATHARADRNPNIMESEWTRGTRHYLVTLYNDGPERGAHRVRTMKVYFSQGPAVREPPNAADVLNSLALDSSSYDTASGFEDWAREFGMEPDQAAKRTWTAVEKNREKLHNFLGPDTYEELLYKTEPL